VTHKQWYSAVGECRIAAPPPLPVYGESLPANKSENAKQSSSN